MREQKKSDPWDIASIVLIAAVFVLLTWMGWMKWTDPIIDFGAEMYVPWQLHEGAVLYRDLASFKGPFSSYLNLLWFTLFGVSLRTLVYANLGILAVITAGLTSLIRRCTDRLTATVAAVVFLVEFGLSNIVSSNFNFVTPFVHELTHGILLSVFLLLVLGKIIEKPTVWRITSAGLLLGCILLTRIEIGVAAIAAVAIAILILLRYPTQTELSTRRMAAILIGSTAITPLIALLFLSHSMPLSEAASGMLGTWKDLFGSRVASTYFFRNLTGLRTPLHSAVSTVISVVLVGNWILAAVMMERLAGKKLSDPAWCLTVGIVIACMMGIAVDPMAPLMGGRELSITTSIIGAYCLYHLWTGNSTLMSRAQWGMWTMFAAFAWALLGKIFLNVHIWHYGFVHAMPATLLLIMTLLWLVPRLLQRYGLKGNVFRIIALIAIIIDALCVLRISAIKFDAKTVPIDTGANEFFIFNDAIAPQERNIDDLMRAIKKNVPAGATLTPLPEGLMINVLTGHKSSVPYLNFMVTEMSIFGEHAMLDAFEKNPPDYIALIHRSTADFGFPFFGQSPLYGKSILDWVHLHYTPIWSEGGDPFAGTAFAAQLVRYTK